MIRVSILLLLLTGCVEYRCDYPYYVHMTGLGAYLCKDETALDCIDVTGHPILLHVQQVVITKRDECSK